jgi:excisionase family DNA binding protein
MTQEGHMQIESPYLTPAQAAVYLNWNGKSAAFRSAVGRLGIPHRRVGRQLRFTRAELDAWMDRQKPLGAKDVKRRRRSA